MYKKFLVSLTAVTTAVSMVIAPSITAFAEETLEDSNSPISFSDNQSHDVGNVTVSVSDSSDSSIAVYASGQGTIVNVEGNVDASGAASYTLSDGREVLSGATGVSVTSDAEVTVSGNVVGGSSGANVSNGASLNVAGNVTATGTDQTIHRWNDETNDYDIPINTVRGDGIWTDGDATIIIDGNVSGVTEGILINPDNDNSKGTIIVAGTISTSAAYGGGIDINKPNSKYDGTDYDTMADAINDIPDITVYEIASATPVYVNMTTKDESTNDDILNSVISAINYIIKKDAASVSDYDLSISGSNIKNVEGYDTVNINEAFTVAANLPDGYTIDGGKNVSVTKNDDGTFTLVLTNAKGGIYISAKLIPVTNSDGTTSYVVEAETNESESTPSYSDPAQVPTGAIVIATSTGSADAPTEISAISGDKPARTVSYSMASITPLQYKNSIIENVAAAPASGAFNIETDRVACFDAKMIAAISARPDIDVNVVFTYGGKKLKVTIPAGYDVSSLLDEFGYCGFLRLMAILGATEL